MNGQVVQLLEATFGERKLKVDREKCIVFGCKILGPKSRNQPPHNNEYPEQTRRRAAPVLEGGRSFVNHDDDSKRRTTRRYQDSFGTHTNIREEGDGLYSDFHYNPKHPIAEQFLWDAENAPHNVGFSIATNGRKRISNGVAIVEEILFDKNSHSIDLVCKGATTNSISEGQMSQPIEKKIRDVLREWAKGKGNAEFSRIVEEDLPAATADASMPAPAEGGGDDPMDAGFKAMLGKLVDQYAAGDIDLQGLIAKLKDIDKAWTKLSGETPAPDAGSGDATAKESQKTTSADPTASLREELAIRDSIEDAGLKFATPAARKAFVKSLVPLNESERTALIEERKTAAAGAGDNKPQPGKTRSAGAGSGSNGSTGGGSNTGRIDESFKPAALTTVADRVAFLRNGKLPAPAAAK